MNGLLKEEVEKVRLEFQKYNNSTITDDRAFNHLLLKHIFGVDYYDREDMITDGPNDGGVDFVYYDEDESKVILGQAKYRETIKPDEIVAEFVKLHHTVEDFRISNTGMYSPKLRNVLQNALDRLPEDNSYNVEYNLFTTAPVNVSKVMGKINSSTMISSDSVKVYTSDDIEKEVESSTLDIKRIESEKIRIDKAKNFLEYKSGNNRGIMCNVSSVSLIDLYNKYAGHGLFDLNIRKYIRNKLVDDGINKTLDKERENFWFLNNGITIACDSFEPDGDTIWLEGFSIVNGGQTTYLIGNYKGSKHGEFFIPCKIVAENKSDPDASFFTKIAEATNSQKPIYARDLKSNTPEMLRIKHLLGDEHIYFENKRSSKKQAKGWKYVIRSDEFAQLILSFVFQQPGTAKNGKQKIFSENDLYSKVFKDNYNEPRKKNFLLDLIDLYDRYKYIEMRLKTGTLPENDRLEISQLEILKNGRQTLLALLGVAYRMANKDITDGDIKNDTRILKNLPLTPDRFISGYSGDDLNEKLESLIRVLITIITECYTLAYEKKTTTSINNFLKADSKYYDEIVSYLSKNLRFAYGKEIKNNMDIFLRN